MSHVAIIEQDFPDVISVSWDTSSLCNYRCTYCDPKFHDGKNRFPELHLVERFMTDLAASSKKKIFFELKGGEPTLWRQFDEFLKLCDERRWGVGLISNITKPLPWWEKNLKYISQVGMSLHPESYILDEVIEKVEFIYKHCRSGALFMLYPPLFEKCVEDVEKIIARLPEVFLRIIVLSRPAAGNVIYDYTPEMQDFIARINSRVIPIPVKVYPDFPFNDTQYAKTLDIQNQIADLDQQDLKLKNQNQWMGWKCRVGLDRIHIGADGNIYRGTCMEGGPIGNLHSGQWDLPQKPITCAKDRCFCGAEMYVKKWNPSLVSLVGEYQ